MKGEDREAVGTLRTETVEAVVALGTGPIAPIEEGNRPLHAVDSSEAPGCMVGRATAIADRDNQVAAALLDGQLAGERRDLEQRLVAEAPLAESKMAAAGKTEDPRRIARRRQIREQRPAHGHQGRPQPGAGQDLRSRIRFIRLNGQR